ncbi:MAG: glutaredoxin family protein [Patescibacteria group bacterium]|nr:glutaredoxin family protein [Patescibacteria group bacterium]
MSVKIYTTPSCVYCKMAKEFFKKNNIEYQELNVALDEKAREDMIQRSHQLGVPVIEINDQVFVGFNRLEIEKALKGLA